IQACMIPSRGVTTMQYVVVARGAKVNDEFQEFLTEACKRRAAARGYYQRAVGSRLQSHLEGMERGPSYSCVGWDQQAAVAVGRRSPENRPGAIRARCGLRRPTNNVRELVPPYMNWKAGNVTPQPPLAQGGATRLPTSAGV